MHEMVASPPPFACLGYPDHRKKGLGDRLGQKWYASMTHAGALPIVMETFFVNRRKFWWENFRGAAKTKPRLPNACYAIYDRSSLFREQRRHECELYFGIHDSFQFEPSLRQCSEVVIRPRSCLPVSLVAGSMAFTALLAPAMLEAGTC